MADNTRKADVEMQEQNSDDETTNIDAMFIIDHQFALN